MIRFCVGFLVLGVGFSLLGCGGDVPIGNDTGGTGGTKSTTGGAGGSSGSISTGGSGGSSTGGQAGSGGHPVVCSTGYDAGTSGTSCTNDSECQSDEVCGFKVSDACSATGKCFPKGPLCNCFSPACGCDGATLNAVCSGLPDGYAPKPVQHDGQCATADSGTGTFACAQTGQTCAAADQYCYGGSETAFYLGDGGIIVGCNAWPADCKANPTCDCLMKYYSKGFCVCTPTDGGITMQCSTV